MPRKPDPKHVRRIEPPRRSKPRKRILLDRYLQSADLFIYINPLLMGDTLTLIERSLLDHVAKGIVASEEADALDAPGVLASLAKQHFSMLRTGLGGPGVPPDHNYAALEVILTGAIPGAVHLYLLPDQGIFLTRDTVIPW